MAVIEIVDWSDNTDISKGAFIKGFNLTSWEDGSSLELAGGRYEDINGFAYKITGGDFGVDTSPATTDGTWYIHIVEDGVTAGNAIAYLDSNAGVYRADLGGYYYDVGGGRLAKVWCLLEKSGADFINRRRYNENNRSNVNTNSLLVDDNANIGGNAVISGAIQTDTISENTPGNGVVIDGAKIKDNDGYFDELRRVTSGPVAFPDGLSSTDTLYVKGGLGVVETAVYTGILTTTTSQIPYLPGWTQDNTIILSSLYDDGVAGNNGLSITNTDSYRVILAQTAITIARTVTTQKDYKLVVARYII